MQQDGYKKRLKTFLVITFTAFLFSCGTPHVPTALSSLLERESIRVGTVYGAATYYNGAEGPQGFEYELLAGFADYLGVTLDVYPFYNYDEMLQQLEDGNLDIVATGDAVTSQLMSRFDYGPRYQQVKQQLVFQAGTARPRSIQDLEAPVVSVTGSSQSFLLYQALENRVQSQLVLKVIYNFFLKV